jgi:hypothetical protein
MRTQTMENMCFSIGDKFQLNSTKEQFKIIDMGTNLSGEINYKIKSLSNPSEFGYINVDLLESWFTKLS